MKQNIQEIYNKLDKVEAGDAVKSSQIKVLAHILSPDNLERRNRELGRLITEIEDVKVRVTSVERMHNGKHPST